MDAEHKNGLNKERLFSSNADTIDPATVRVSAIRFRRNNNACRTLTSLCQMIPAKMLLYAKTDEMIQPDNTCQMSWLFQSPPLTPTRQL